MVVLNIVLTALALLVFHFLTRRRIPNSNRLPPGPRGWPIFGNVTDMPQEQQWKTFAIWAKEYGDLVYLNVFGKSMISVNSVAVAQDLFQSRSLLYSDRVCSPMIRLMGGDWFFGHTSYGDKWRWHRKTFHRYFNATAVIGYRDIELKHTRILLQKLYNSPKDFIRHLRYFPGATIMEIVYGIKVLPVNDPYIESAEKALVATAAAGNPGTFLVDMIPMLRYVPEWFPGASFRRKARIWRESIIQLPLVPYEAVKTALRVGKATPSIMASLIEEMYSKTEVPLNYEVDIQNNAGAAYGAGSDTTVSVLTTFTLAMVLYQDVQRKAQAELDSRVGERLPEFTDRDHLPYVNVICKEVHRWHPVAPLGFAHVVKQDDIYGDIFIPKRSILLPNAWAMLHDEKEFGPNTEQFRPERYFEPGIADPISVAFGFGRRVCPGQHVAEDSIFIAVASILKMYNISLAKDAEGKEIPVEAKFTSGFLSHPEPFVCSITPRSALAESMLAECTRE